MKFYLTTPIYYVNGDPHIGHTYTTVMADCIARFHRMEGDDVYFMTGTDEHGQKIYETAQKQGIQPRQYADTIAAAFQGVWKTLGITYDRFIRTTEPNHEEVVKTVFKRLMEQGDIYAGEYKGFYCVHCELYVEPSAEGVPCCPDCNRPVGQITEHSYFFKLSAYEQRIRDHIAAHPDFIKPDFRKNEVLKFLERGLHDISFTRKNVPWGVPSPTPENYSIYVWCDALLNYISGIGYLRDEAVFKKWWPADVHLMSKDIIRFHCVIWPALLMALELPLPGSVFVHGYWVMGKDKMSKSKGNVISPLTLIEDYGVDALRFFLAREVPFGMDGEYSPEVFKKRYNSDLANDLGNLVNRTLHLCGQKCGNITPEGVPSEALTAMTDGIMETYRKEMAALNVSAATGSVWGLVTHGNKYLDTAAPWRLEGAEAGRVLYEVLEVIRRAALLLAPFIPTTSAKIWKMLGRTDDPSAGGFALLSSFLKPGTPLGEKEILFPRRK